MIPKVELHLHLEGAAPPDFVRDLASRRAVDLSFAFDETGAYTFNDFNDFLRIYEAVCTVLRSPRDFADLTRAVIRQSAESGVIHTEAFVSPDFCGGRDLGAWREYLAAIQEAAAEAEAETGTSMRAVVTCIRHFGPEAAKSVAHCAAHTANGFVTGFGMAGDELRGRPADFAYAFDMAREAGLGLTAHAGEWGGAAMVRETLDALRPARIGHGIGAASDPALMERLVESGIVLEVCPGSNVALRAVPSWAAHPIGRLRDAGVALTVSTDDPPFFRTDMETEYAMLTKHFGWEDETFRDIARTAARAAFCDDGTRDALLKRIEA